MDRCIQRRIQKCKLGQWSNFKVDRIETMSRNSISFSSPPFIRQGSSNSFRNSLNSQDYSIQQLHSELSNDNNIQKFGVENHQKPKFYQTLLFKNLTHSDRNAILKPTIYPLPEKVPSHFLLNPMSPKGEQFYSTNNSNNAYTTDTGNTGGISSTGSLGSSNSSFNNSRNKMSFRHSIAVSGWNKDTNSNLSKSNRQSAILPSSPLTNDLLGLELENNSGTNSSQIQIYHSLSAYDRFILCGGNNGFTIVKPTLKPEGFSVTEWKRIWVSRGPETKRIQSIRWNENGIVGCGENGVWRMNVDISNLDDDDTSEWYEETKMEESISLEMNPYNRNNSKNDLDSTMGTYISKGRKYNTSTTKLSWYGIQSQQSKKNIKKSFSHVSISQQHLLALEENRIHVWDWERTNDTKLSLRGSISELTTAKWSPFESHGSMILALGAKNGSVKVLDLRETDDASNLVSWRRDRAHNDTIRDLAWSPFVSHWLATSSNSGDIHIWDLRYQRDPVVKLLGHYNVVKTISWSLNHCEMLASGGADQQVRIWSLKNEPYYELESIKSNFVSPIVGLEYSESRQKNLFSLSALGSLNCINITPAFLRPLVSSRYSEKAEREQHIENMIYNRQFKTAFHEITTYATELKNNGEVEKALSLLDLCNIRNPATKIKHKDPEVRFKMELEEYSYFLPPNMKSNDYDRAWKMKKTEITNLVLNSQILLYVKQRNVRKLEQLKPKIFEILIENLNFIEIASLKETAELFINHNYSIGIDFVCELIKIYHTRSDISNIESILNFIIGEHVYEAKQNPSLSEESFENYSTLLKDSHYILIQLDYHRKLTSALWESPDSGQTIINVVDESTVDGDPTHLSLLSTSLVRLFLEALLAKKRFGRFYIVSCELLQKYHGFDLELILQDLMKRVALPQLIKLEQEELNKYNIKTDPVKYVKKLQNIAIILLSLSLHCPFIPDYLLSNLKSNLQALKEELESVIDSVQSDRNHKKIFSSLSEYLENIIENVKRNQTKWSVQIQKKMERKQIDASDPSGKPIRDLADSILQLIQQKLN